MTVFDSVLQHPHTKNKETLHIKINLKIETGILEPTETGEWGWLQLTMETVRSQSKY